MVGMSCIITCFIQHIHGIVLNRPFPGEAFRCPSLTFNNACLGPYRAPSHWTTGQETRLTFSDEQLIDRLPRLHGVWMVTSCYLILCPLLTPQKTEPHEFLGMMVNITLSPSPTPVTGLLSTCPRWLIGNPGNIPSTDWDQPWE